MTRPIALLLALALASSAPAAPLSRADVPEALRPWIDWALHGSEAKLCPNLLGSAEALRCAWPARIFSRSTRAAVASLRPGRWRRRSGWRCPATRRRPPLDVRLDGAAGGGRAARRRPGGASRAGQPHASPAASAGTRCPRRCRSRPRPGSSLSSLARQAGRRSRTATPRAGVAADAPPTAGEGEEKPRASSSTAWSTDDVPLMLATRIELSVSGKSREVLLGRALPEGFVPMALDGPLPARLEPDGRLRVQLRPGTWTIELVARHARAGGQRSPAADARRALGRREEVWVFEARTDLAAGRGRGRAARSIPQQTTPPRRVDAAARPTAVRAGEHDAARRAAPRRRRSRRPTSSRLERTLWLDFDGRGYTIQRPHHRHA